MKFAIWKSMDVGKNKTSLVLVFQASLSKQKKPLRSEVAFLF
jgi:hypothetical protein